MTNPQKKPIPEETRPSSQEVESGKSDLSGKRFEEAYQKYMHALQQTQIAAQKQSLNVYREYCEAKQNSWLETQKQFSDANHRYARALEDTWGQKEAQQLLIEAYRDYGRSLRDACDEAQKRCEEINRKHAEPLQRLGDDVKKSWEGAYRDYVAAVKNAWAAVEAGALDAQTLVAVSQSIAVAAFFAGGYSGLSSGLGNE
jgi:hypothetical protein